MRREEFLEERENDYTGNSFSQTTLKRYSYNRKFLLKFQEDYKIKVSFSGFNEKLYNKFLKYYIEEKQHSANNTH